jgi:hypothetical protein
MSTPKVVSTEKPATSQAPAINKPTVTKTTLVKPAAKVAVKPKATIAKPIVTTKAAPVKTVVDTKTKKAEKETKAAKVEKEKTPKLKMERDSFTMPKAEYAQFYVLKDRLIKLGQPVKKSELLRAGLMLLSALTDANLKAAMSKVPAIKTGRPKK